MGAGERRTRGRSRIVVKITNKDNPELAAKMAGFSHCGIYVGIILIIPGIILASLGFLFQTFQFYIGCTLLGIAGVLLITCLLLCLFVVKPSCCYPNASVVGTSVGGRLVNSVEPAVPTVSQQSNTAVMMGGSQPANSQYATNYGTPYGQPVAPPQYGTTNAPPPTYEQSQIYPPPADAVYPPPPPAATY